MASKDDIVAAATNLHFSYSMLHPDKDGLGHMPSMYFIKVALDAGIEATIPSLLEAFPFERDWGNQADFRAHLQEILQEDDYKRILQIADKIGAEIAQTDLELCHPSFFDEFTRNTPESERFKLLWRDDASMSYLRARWTP